MNPNPEIALQAAILASFPDRTPQDTFHASSLGHCPRKQIARRAGIPPVISTTMHAQFKMSTGMVLGRWISDLLIQQGYLDPTWTEKHLVLGEYSGRPDGFTPHVNGGAIVEIKTADDRSVTKDELPEHYLWQLSWYCIAADVNTGVLFQIGKNQGLSRHRVLQLTDEWRQKITDEMEEMNIAWVEYQVSKTLPPCQHRFLWEERWCAYQTKI